jgi:hypothetical protein
MLLQTKMRHSPVFLEDRMLTDRRSSSRTPAMIQAWLWQTEDPEETDEPLPILILDFAERGVGMLTYCPLKVGERIDLDMEGDGMQRVALKVTRCVLNEGCTFRVGACCVGATPPRLGE